MMEKELEILDDAIDFLCEHRAYQKQAFKGYEEHSDIEDIERTIDGLRKAQETIKDLKHNYDVQVEYNNTAYKNYTNMVNSLEKRIAQLKEAMKPKACEWKNLEDDESYGWLSSCGCCYPHQKVWFQFCPMCGYKVIKNEPKDNA